MWIRRQLAAEVVALSRSFPVVVLVGPRQVGKTSLLENTLRRSASSSLSTWQAMPRWRKPGPKSS